MDPAIVDLLFVVLIGYFALSGLRTGLVVGMLNLAGLAITLAVAATLQQPLGQAVSRQAGFPTAIGNLIAFFGVLALAQVVFAIAKVPVVASFRIAAAAFPPLSWLDRVLGVVPGLVRGLLAAMLVVLPFGVFPIWPPATTAIQASRVGSFVLSAALDVKTQLESGIGRDLADGLELIGPQPAEEGRQLPFKIMTGLRPDTDDETRMLNLINQERRQAGLSPLAADPALRTVARQHGEDMFRLGYFSHYSPATGSPADRVRAAGIGFGVIGENLAYAPSLDIAHQGLMDSSGHRANILSPVFRRVGIGVVRSDFRGKMYVQEFRD